MLNFRGVGTLLKLNIDSEQLPSQRGRIVFQTSFFTDYVKLNFGGLFACVCRMMTCWCFRYPPIKKFSTWSQNCLKEYVLFPGVPHANFDLFRPAFFWKSSQMSPVFPEKKQPWNIMKWSRTTLSAISCQEQDEEEEEEVHALILYGECLDAYLANGQPALNFWGFHI